MDEKIKKESENEFTSIEEENKIIEEIIKNRLLIKETHFDKDYSDLEEDENEDDISEKDKITEEILDNKLSFIVLKMKMKNLKKKLKPKEKYIKILLRIY